MWKKGRENSEMGPRSRVSRGIRGDEKSGHTEKAKNHAFRYVVSLRRQFANYVKNPEFKKLIKELNYNFAQKYPHYGFLSDWRITRTEPTNCQP